MKDIHARTPVDQVARRVISSGVAWALNMKPGGAVLSDTPLPTRPTPAGLALEAGEINPDTVVSQRYHGYIR